MSTEKNFTTGKKEKTSYQKKKDWTMTGTIIHLINFKKESFFNSTLKKKEWISRQKKIPF